MCHAMKHVAEVSRYGAPVYVERWASVLRLRQTRVHKTGGTWPEDPLQGLHTFVFAVQLARRVFIRHSMWHELRVVLHNRENTLLVQTLQNFGRDEREFAEVALATWNAFAEEVESMPLDA